MGRESKLKNNETNQKTQVAEYLKIILSKGMKLPANKIEAFVPFENYGIDSILTMKLTVEMEKVFGSLSKTLFFEYRNLDELAAYFYENHYEKLQKLGVIERPNEMAQVKKLENEKSVVATESHGDLSYVFGKFNQYTPVTCGGRKTKEATSVEQLMGENKQSNGCLEADNMLAGNAEVGNVEAGNTKVGNTKVENTKVGNTEAAFRKTLDIAIIGIAGKYPKAANVQEFWNNISGGMDCITQIPKDRWDNDRYYDPDKDKKHSIYSKWGGFIDGVDEFDPIFFHIAPKEAKGIDPQERLFLECAYHAMEDAGYTRENITKQADGNLGCNVGVYVGVMFDDYQLFGIEEQMKENIMSISGVSASIANRVSYTFNFNGPSMVIGTQCSSSLSSIHLACQSLKEGECEVAIAGGVNVCLHPNKYILLSQGKFLSSQGKCLSFGEGGDGYVPSEGVGAVILKPLRRAKEDGDHIYGIIRESAINHGGKTNGYTVPNPVAQGELIHSVYEKSGINPRTVSYIEAHGTGTSLGDPIEITGLCRAFEKDTQEKGFCEIGSVKSNIGHCESAAGIASLTKVLLQMQHKQIVPSIHSEVLNPYIDFDNTPFHVPQELKEWKQPVIAENGKLKKYPLRAGISSFGAGGSNAHLLVEEYQAEVLETQQLHKSLPTEVMIVLSAKTKERLMVKVEDLISYLRENKTWSLTDIAYTLAVGREQMDSRVAFVVSNSDELLSKLTSVLHEEEDADIYYGDKGQRNLTLPVDNVEDYVQELIEKQEYDELLKLWVNGNVIPWEEIYREDNYHRVSLPGYPFEQQRYWIDRSNNEIVVLKAEKTESAKLEARNTQEEGATQEDKVTQEEKNENEERTIQEVRDTQEKQEEKKLIQTEKHRVDLKKNIIGDIAKIIEEILQIPQKALDYDESFADFGFDSLSIVEFAGAISGKYNITLTPDVIYSYQNMNRLSEYLMEQYKEQMKVVYPDEKEEKNEGVEKITQKTVAQMSRKIASSETVISIDEVEAKQEVAIVGMAGRFPDARTIDELWEIIASGRDVIRKVPSERKEWNQVYEGLSEEECDKYKIGVLPGVDEFDSDFFDITPIEAESMDPRQRILLEEMWHALEDAGFGKRELSQERIGVFVGAEESDYRKTLSKEIGILSNHNAVLAARLAYLLDLHGPNFTLNTACSSGLVALHLAQESIKNGECDAAIVAGANILPISDTFVAMQKAGMLSPNSVCSPFGHDANGMVAAEAVAVIVLERADRAREQGQHIYATIVGSGINYDGKTNGLTAPSGQAQMDLLNQIYNRYGIQVDDIEYMLAHGTGTKLGDPIEVNSLSSVWKKRTKKQEYCALGSVKANIGHTQAASGLVSLITLVKAMEKEVIPTSIHCNVRNEFIDWNNSPFFINTKNRPWKTQEGRFKYGAVSAFGVSGTNAHLVIRHESVKAQEQKKEKSQLLVFSAKTKEALLQKLKDTETFLEEANTATLQEVASTLFAGRTHFRIRCAFVAESLTKAKEILKEASKNLKEASESLKEADEIFTEVVVGTKREQLYYQELSVNHQPDDELAQLVEQEVKQALEAMKDDDTQYVESLQRLAQYYCDGYETAMEAFYEAQGVTKISMPGYPFVRNHYWGTRDNIADEQIAPTMKEYLHPLVHSNESTLEEQVFVSEFTGKEAVFAHHKIGGVSTLPGAAYLEMAREAIQRSMGEAGTLILRNIGWFQPIQAVGDSICQVKILIGANHKQELEFSIESKSKSDEYEVNCQGNALLVDSNEAKIIDYQQIVKEDSQRITREECYQFFQEKNMIYGSSFRTVQQILRQNNSAVVELDAGNAIDARYQMYYGMLDGALQATISFAEKDDHTLVMPYAIDQVIIYAPLQTHMWAVIVQKKASRVLQYNIDLCDEAGNVCVHIENYTARIAEEAAESKEEASVVLNKQHSIATSFDSTVNPIAQRAVASSIDSSAQRTIAPSVTQAVMTASLEEEDIMEEESIYREQVVSFLSKVIADGLKLPVERIKVNENFEALGIDSILMMHLTNQLEDIFGTLPKTLFFEYSTVYEMSQYFIDTYSETLERLIPKRKKLREEKLTSHLMSKESPEDRRIVSKKQLKKFTSLAGLTCSTRGNREEIAIIGLAGKYPNANNVEEFFENLCQGLDCITEIPKERWDYQQYYDSNKKVKGKTNCKWGGFLQGVDEFDPLFFHISPREAEIIDPQERLFLECVYETMEDAGYTKDNICEKEEGENGCNVGVFVGSMTSEYQLYGAQEQTKGNMVAVNGINASIANRVSFFFNFSGPSMSLDTQCSSSLTAIHLACQSILSGDCNVAIAGGVNITIHPNKYLLLSNGNFMASNGRCMSFGEGGDGYVPGEGVGSILLKPLSKAIEDGDHIYAVIKGTAVNHGGKTSGYTVPNPNAQSRVIEKAILNAGVDARGISYIEAHGTGTSLGDPIEINGMTKAFRKFTQEEQFCAIGSVKSNIGHCEGAAGMAAITKVIKQMQYKKLVPSIHSETLNPYIQFEHTPFIVQRELADWEHPRIEQNGREVEYPLLAGISSFGAGGSNAHVILEEYVPYVEEVREEEKPLIFLISAKSKEQLYLRTKSLYETAMKTHYSLTELEAVAYTLALGREAMDYRAGFVASTVEEYCSKLCSYLEGNDIGTKVYEAKTEESNPMVLLLDYEELQDAMVKIAKKGKYEKLIQFWIYGYDVDWQDLFDVMNISHHRISLPTYPFAKEKYWLTITQQTQKAIVNEEIREKNNEKNNENNCQKQGGSVSSQTAEVVRVQWNQVEKVLDTQVTYQEKLCICIGQSDLAQEIERITTDWQVVRFEEPSSVRTDVSFMEVSQEVFQSIKELLQNRSKGKTRVLILAPCHPQESCYYGLSGLMRTAYLENPTVVTTLIEVDDWKQYEVKELLLESVKERHVRYQQQKRLLPTYESIQNPQQENYHFTDHGVYVITGGAGGLGKIFAKEIADKTNHSCIVLTGRSKRSPEIEAFLETLRGNSNTAIYLSMDVQNKLEVTTTMQELRQQYGRITGVLHAAGINIDRYLIMKSTEEFQNVLGPKVIGTVNLDEATKDDKLDFFLCFSSVSGCFGNAGQVDYATGNAFMDGYMKVRNELVQQGVRTGKSISINWPLWKNGGMHVDQQTEQLLEKGSGLSVLSTEAGVAAFYTILAAIGDEFICLVGDEKRYGKLIGRNESSQQRAQQASVAERRQPSTKDLDEQFADYLKGLLSKAIKLSPDKIDMDVTMDAYGIDSVMTLEMTDELETVFGRLPKTLFFEYKTLQALHKYLMQNYKEEIVKILSPVSDAEMVIEIQDDDSRDTIKTQEDDSQGDTIELERNAKESEIHDHDIHNSDMQESDIPKSKSQESDSQEHLEQERRPLQPTGTGAEKKIAIIGLAGKYPGAEDVEELWENLLQGKDCVTRIPKSRWDNDKYFNPDASVHETIHGDWGGFMDGVEEFDPYFFKIAPRDVEYMDPQERLFLECVYHAIEDAGYTRESLAPAMREDLGSNVGVFVGTVNNEYQLFGAVEQEKGHLIAMNGGVASIANRVSYICNFCGPSMAVDSQCSSSMTAIYLAYESLLHNKCDVAIAGGVNLLLHPNRYVMLSGGKFLSSKGQCAAFGAGGDGYVPGEGVGAILLKPLDQAIKDHDHIYGVIQGITVNHGGKTNGFTVPNPNAQSDLIERALRESKVDPRTISYVEAHGTGTSLGDPIEVAGLTSAYQKFTRDTQYCSIGSIKSNIGHCEGAAGIASITKVLLQMKHHTLVPSLHTEELNPYIDYEQTPFYVQRKVEEWKRPVLREDGEEVSYPLRAAISGFGAGGSNVHMILEEYRAKPLEQPMNPEEFHLILLSAQSKEQVQTLANQLRLSVLKDMDERKLRSITYTLALGREPQEYRLAIYTESMMDLVQQLQAFLDGVETSDRIFYGQTLGKTERKKLSPFILADEVNQCGKDKNWKRLIELWLQGHNIDWRQLQSVENQDWRRLSLVQYPFAKEKFWLEQWDHRSEPAMKDTYAKETYEKEVHAKENDRKETHAKETAIDFHYTGDEYFIADHLQVGQKIIAETSFFEMIRKAAVETKRVTGPLQLQEIRWREPLIIEQEPIGLRVKFLEDNRFILTDCREERYPDGICAGRLISLETTPPSKLNLSEEIKACDKELAVAACYDLLDSFGLKYSDTFQTLQKIYFNDDLCIVKLRTEDQKHSDDLGIYPELLTGAIQACITFSIENDKGMVEVPSLPFTLDEVTLYAACDQEMWAVIRRENLDQHTFRYEIELCNTEGTVKARMVKKMMCGYDDEEHKR